MSCKVLLPSATCLETYKLVLQRPPTYKTAGIENLIRLLASIMSQKQFFILPCIFSVIRFSIFTLLFLFLLWNSQYPLPVFELSFSYWFVATLDVVWKHPSRSFQSILQNEIGRIFPNFIEHLLYEYAHQGLELREQYTSCTSSSVCTCLTLW